MAQDNKLPQQIENDDITMTHTDLFTTGMRMLITVDKRYLLEIKSFHANFTANLTYSPILKKIT